MSSWESRIQLVRLVAISAKNHGFIWHMSGQFLRCLLAGSSDVDASEVCFMLAAKRATPTPTIDKVFDNISHILNGLQIMGVFINTSETNPSVVSLSSGTYEGEPLHVNVKCHITLKGTVIPMSIKAFDSIIHIFSPSLYPYSCDSIVISETSMYVLTRDENIDRFNQYTGISLLERMCSLRQQTTTQTIPFSSGDFDKRDRNLLLRLCELNRDNIRVIGNTVDIPEIAEDTYCPVCFDSNVPSIALQCSHSFCLNCLTKLVLYVEVK
jgi:hypothetical protein